jgi:hypothetical protein
MSNLNAYITVSSNNINYSNSTNIYLNNFKNFQILSNPVDNSIKINKINNKYSIISITPFSTTQYTIYGQDYNNNIVSFNQIIIVNFAIFYNNSYYFQNSTTPIVFNVYYNTPITVTLLGANSYSWNPITFLNLNSKNDLNDGLNNVAVIIPTNNITYQISGQDQFSNNSTISFSINIIYSFTFTPVNPTVYEGNKIEVNIVGIDNENNQNTYNNSITNNINYIWTPTTSKYLPANQAGIKYGSEITVILYKSMEYIVNAYIDNQLIGTNNLKINILEKPSSVIDVDVIPCSLYMDVINRNSKELKKLLLQDRILSDKLINFYYTTLETAYRLEWTNKFGGNSLINWYSVYQQMNESSQMIITFKQQWKFFKYIQLNQTRNNKTASNFAFLLNNLNQLYLEKPEKVYIINN